MSRKSIFRRNALSLCAAYLCMTAAAPSLAAQLEKPAPKNVTRIHGETLAVRKAALLSDINVRLYDLRKKQDCITAAKDKDAVRACLDPAQKRPARKAEKPRSKH